MKRFSVQEDKYYSTGHIHYIHSFYLHSCNNSVCYVFYCIYISSHSSSIQTQTFLEQHLLGESLCIFKNTTRIALLLLLFWSLLFRSVPGVGSTIGRFSWVSSTLYGCNGELMTELGQLSLFACLESRVTRIHFVASRVFRWLLES